MSTPSPIPPQSESETKKAIRVEDWSKPVEVCYTIAGKDYVQAAKVDHMPLSGRVMFFRDHEGERRCRFIDAPGDDLQELLSEWGASRYSIRNAPESAPSAPVETWTATAHEPCPGVTLWNSFESAAKNVDSSCAILIDGVQAAEWDDDGSFLTDDVVTIDAVAPRQVTNPNHSPEALATFAAQWRASRDAAKIKDSTAEAAVTVAAPEVQERAEEKSTVEIAFDAFREWEKWMDGFEADHVDFWSVFEGMDYTERTGLYAIMCDIVGKDRSWLAPVQEKAPAEITLPNDPEAVETKLEPYTAETWPKGLVWIRGTEWQKSERSLVMNVSDFDGVVYHIGKRRHAHQFKDLVKHREISLDGGITWQPAARSVSAAPQDGEVNRG